MPGSLDRTTSLFWSGRRPRERVVLTHDVSTLTKHAYDRVAAGQPMPGVLEVGAEASVGPVIDDLLLLGECSHEGEWEGQVRYLPL